MAGLEHLEAFIREKIEKERWTHVRLSAFLQQEYPGERGLGVRSLQNFCSEKDIHKTSRVSSEDLDQAVADAIAKVNYWLCDTSWHNVKS